MLYLWLTIFCSTTIYFLFKLKDRFKVNLSGAIIINYLVATLLGLALKSEKPNLTEIVQASWLPIAFIIGLLFVVMFYLIGLSTNKTGIAVTTIATRMSMVLPILFSIFIFNEPSNIFKYLKIGLTFIAVILAIYHKPDKKLKPLYTILPFILFIGSGSVDTLVKIAQHLYIPENEVQLFSSSLFGISFIASLIMLFIKKPGEQLFNKSTLLLGAALGTVNFGSLYFIINALNKSNLDSSILFGINNLAIVCCSLLLGKVFFNEKLTTVNWIGIILSIFCIILLIK